MHVPLPLFRWTKFGVGYRLSITAIGIVFSVNDHSGIRAPNPIIGIILKQNEQLEALAVHGIRKSRAQAQRVAPDEHAGQSECYAG
jgi:hypothetical protein